MTSERVVAVRDCRSVVFQRLGGGQVMDQKLRALELANEVRMQAAKVKREIRVLPLLEGRAMVADVLRNEPERVGSMTASQLLNAIKRAGPSKVAGWCGRAGVPASKRVKNMTVNQRLSLADQVDPNVKREDVTSRGFWRNAA
jgi:hypothetical protein